MMHMYVYLFYRNYRGFVQLLKKNISEHRENKIIESEKSRKKKNAKTPEVKNEIMCEFLVEIPKV